MEEELTYTTWHDEKAQRIEADFKDSLDVLKWAYREYGDRVVYACSFGAEGIVLLDLINKVKKNAKVLFLDTNLHFKETYDLISKVKKRYPELQIDMKKPRLTLLEQEKDYGEKLWERDPNQCCHIRKVEPLTESLTGTPAWISGLRREQSDSRKNTNYLNKDNKFQSIKICPLIHWTWKDVWMYITLHNLDYNVLHDHGYPSIGCEKCTLPATDPYDTRSGRWANTGKTECGLHSI
ncbi:phosphoadenylyl-sulfate reductase [Pueribacillus theae]|uniref:Adenosine 5'-phosphosulfate reductase n=1 Tax=Pueribacillus theae TaxID=2171751 RepID=A0A2U1JX53_9BACI|nr:phosphoadenylyl-sulfate reductase [Pueribacillus theae]PWA09702.1 phosphoadenylyl-sulfate reductase [Pueribacillus theae]